ncbi:MAG: DUF211 domain-containing protein [Candidatus Udaeobacter sp.]
MNIRRLALDVDKARERPDLITLAAAIEEVAGVEAVNITVSGIDMETVGTQITVEGEHIDFDVLRKAIESTGAVVNSVDQIVAGRRTIEWVKRVR